VRPCANHQAGAADAEEADRSDQPRVGPAQQIAGREAHEQLRDRDPHQGLPDLECPKTPNHLEKLRNGVRGGQNGKPQEGDQQQQARERRCKGDPQIDAGVGCMQFVHQERDQQQGAGQQQTPHQSRMGPVEAVTLIQGGVDQRQGNASGGETENIGGRASGVDRVGTDAEAQTQGHTHGERHILPKDPCP